MIVQCFFTFLLAGGSTGAGDLLDEGGSSKSKSYDFTSARLTVGEKVLHTGYFVAFPPGLSVLFRSLFLGKISDARNCTCGVCK